MNLQRDSRLVQDLDCTTLMRPYLLHFDRHKVLWRLAVSHGAIDFVSTPAKHCLMLLCVLWLGTICLLGFHERLIVDAVGDGGPIVLIHIYVWLLSHIETVRQL